MMFPEGWNGLGPWSGTGTANEMLRDSGSSPGGCYSLSCFAPPLPPPPPRDCFAAGLCGVKAPSEGAAHAPTITHTVTKAESYQQACNATGYCYIVPTTGNANGADGLTPILTAGPTSGGLTVGEDPTPQPAVDGASSGSNDDGGSCIGQIVDLPTRKTTTQDEIDALNEYAKRSNAWLKANGGAVVQSTKGQLGKEKDAAASAERIRAAKAGVPYTGQAGHVPDTALSGQAIPPAGWLDMPGKSNSIAGGVLGSRVGKAVCGFTVDGQVPK